MNNDFISVGFPKETRLEENLVLKKSLSSTKGEKVTVNWEIGKETHVSS